MAGAVANAAEHGGLHQPVQLFTYITPLLQQVTALTPRAVTWVLLLFGLGLTIGNLAGGRLVDWWLVPSVVTAYAALVLVLLGFAYTCHFPLPAMVTVGVWGAMAFALISPLQMWVVDAASGASNLASTLNQSAFNLGNSISAWAGGAAITGGFDYAELPWLDAAIAGVGFSLVVLTTMQRRRAHA